MKQTFYITSGDADYLKDVPNNRRYMPVPVKQRVLPATMHYTRPSLETEIEKLIK